MEEIKELEAFLKNGFFNSYQCGSASLINNFLHDTSSELTQQKYVYIDLDQAVDEIIKNPSLKKFDEENIKEQILVAPVIYTPITPLFIQRIIEIDTVFRASKNCNTPLTVYRGAPRLDENALSGIVSTSLDIGVAKDFYKGALLKIKLPKGFPYIRLGSEDFNSTFNPEKEVLLPPCSFKIISKTTLPHEDFPDWFPEYYKFYEIEVKEKSLAECLLNRMKNPPEDYFNGLVKEDEIEFKKALKILEEYVNEYVKTGKLKFPTSGGTQPGE